MNFNQRKDSPRPDFYREKWISLNGEWTFKLDDEEEGLRRRYELQLPEGRSIRVPFCYQSEESGIGEKEIHRVLWYERSIVLPKEWGKEHVWLHFGAVDHDAKVWVNGTYAGEHHGGFTPFCFEVTDFIDEERKLRITVRCLDANTPDLVRGKQHWNQTTDRCWYTATSGIWQSVWLEAVPGIRISDISIQSDIDTRAFSAEIALDREICGTLFWEIRRQENGDSAGKAVCRGTLEICGRRGIVMTKLPYPDPIDNVDLWSPEHPNLYDFIVRVEADGKLQDEVAAYFGLRKIAVEHGRICLNHVPLFQRLVLDQGYWPGTLMTPPDHEALIRDISLTKQMGFNGVRKHQKLEDPRFLYEADRMGLLVWEELPSAYEFTDCTTAEIAALIPEMIRRDGNHPCIITWLLFNESWGIRHVQVNSRQQELGISMYHLVKSLDETRLISTNDGWEALPSDFIGIHDYEQDPEIIRRKYEKKEALMHGYAAARAILADGTPYRYEPVLVTEMGGVALEDHDSTTWGYHDKARNPEMLLEKMRGMMEEYMQIPWKIQGICYTQLTDVEQETNGLLYPDRTPKADLSQIRKIMTQEY